MPGTRPAERCTPRRRDDRRRHGLRDASVEIAEAEGARVEHFAWIDDFAAARNHALQASRCEHVFFLDADEWVAQGDSDVLRVWARAAGDDEAGEIAILSTGQSEGRAVASRVNLPRMLPRSCYFVGRVHEQPRGYGTTSSVAGLVVAHDGYEPDQQSRKRGRNEGLLRSMLAESPHDPYLTFQLGRERQIAGDYSAAAGLFLDVLSTTSAASWRDELQARTLFTLHRCGRADEALTLATRFLRESPSAEVVFAAGNLYLDVAVDHPERPGRLVALARTAWRACLTIGEPIDARDGTPGCGSYLAADNLAALCAAEGDEDGRRHWAAEASRMRAESPVAPRR